MTNTKNTTIMIYLIFVQYMKLRMQICKNVQIMLRRQIPSR